MRISTIIVLILSVFIANISTAQRISRVSSGADISFGLKESAWSPSLHYYQSLNPANAKWLQFQWGLKGWGFSDKSANLASRGTSLQSDSLFLGKVNHLGVSFTMGLGFKVGRLEVGAMTDVLSLVFGAARSGIYQLATTSNISPDIIDYHNQLVPSKPTFLNAIPLGLKGQNGQTELYVRYKVSTQFGIKVGYLLGQQSYTTDYKLNNNQSRFSNEYGMPFVAFSFPMFN